MKHIILITFAVLSTVIIAGCMQERPPLVLREIQLDKFDKVRPELLKRVQARIGTKPNIGHINRIVNKTITYQEDVVDEWQTPAETLALGTGDCEDYALLKIALINQYHPNVHADLLIVRDTSLNQDHAVVLIDGGTILDNQVNFAYDINEKTFRQRYLPIGYAVTRADP